MLNSLDEQNLKKKTGLLEEVKKMQTDKELLTGAGLERHSGIKQKRGKRKSKRERGINTE